MAEQARPPTSVRPPMSARVTHGPGGSPGGQWRGVPVARPPASPTRPHAAAGTNTDRRALIRLRRRRLFVLLAVIPVTALLAGLLGGVWIAIQLLADAAVVGYVAHLRRTAQAERRLRASRFALDRRIAAERAVRYGYRLPGPGAAGTGLGGDAGGSAAGPWASGSEPFRLSDPAAGPHGAPAGRGVSEDDLAVANAQTVDLSRVAAAAARTTAVGGFPRGQVLEGTVIDGTAVDRSTVDRSVVDGPAAGGTAHGQAADDPARRWTATAQVAAADAASDPEYAHAGPDDVEFAVEAAGNADADGSADAAEADGAQDPGQTPGSAAGCPAGCPDSRPSEHLQAGPGAGQPTGDTWRADRWPDSDIGTRLAAARVGQRRSERGRRTVAQACGRELTG